MILYHYTCRCAAHLGSILRDGTLKVTESNIGSADPKMPPHGVHVAPDVVWLTTSQNPIGTQGLDGSSHDKTTARIVVDVPDAHHWQEWSQEQGMHPRWRRRLERGCYPSQWYVVERPIPCSEWVSIEVGADSVDKPLTSHPVNARQRSPKGH